MNFKLPLVLLLVTACGSPPEGGTNLASSGEVDASADAVDETEASDSTSGCVQRGIAYFKEIGSYPTLQSPPNSGRAAEDVVIERCQRTTTAF